MEERVSLSGSLDIDLQAIDFRECFDRPRSGNSVDGHAGHGDPFRRSDVDTPELTRRFDTEVHRAGSGTYRHARKLTTVGEGATLVRRLSAFRGTGS